MDITTLSQKYSHSHGQGAQLSRKGNMVCENLLIVENTKTYLRKRPTSVNFDLTDTNNYV